MSPTKHDDEIDDQVFRDAMGAIGVTGRGKAGDYDAKADAAFARAVGDVVPADGAEAEAGSVGEGRRSAPALGWENADALFERAMADGPPASSAGPQTAKRDRGEGGDGVPGAIEEPAPDWSEADVLFSQAMAGAPIVEPSAPLPARPRGPSDGARHHGNTEKLKRKIAKGGIAAEARLDLHGKTRDKAFDALKQFLRGAQTNDHNMVQIVFGRGLHSKGEAILKPAVMKWLRTEFGETVQRIIPAPRNQGGEGACYVVVRKRR